jgi:hypothetical protein
MLFQFYAFRTQTPSTELVKYSSRKAEGIRGNSIERSSSEFRPRIRYRTHKTHYILRTVYYWNLSIFNVYILSV